MTDKIIVQPEVKAAQVYDMCVEEFRIAQLTNIEAEICLAMLMGAMMNSAYKSDREVIDSMKRITEEAGVYYERAKQLGKKQHDEERSIIKLDA